MKDPSKNFATILQEYLCLLHLLIFYAPEAEEGILAFIFWRWQHSIYPFGEKYEFFMRQRLLQSRFEIAEPRISRPTQPKHVISKKRLEINLEIHLLTFTTQNSGFYRVCPKSWPSVVVSWIPRRCQCCRIAIPYLIVHVQSGFEGLAPSLAIFSSILFMSCKSWRLNLTNWEIAGLTLTKAIRAIQ